MVARRYFDRTPGTEGDTGETTRIVNNYIESTSAGEFEALAEAINDLNGRVSAVSGGAQTVSVASGNTTIDLSQGTRVHVASTDGAWSPIFTNVPADGVEVVMSINTTTDDDEMTVPNVSWYGTAPVTADWDAGETIVVRLTKMPLVDTWIAEWLFTGTAPVTEPTVTPVTITAVYTTPEDRVTVNTLNGATLPAGEVYVWLSPVDNSDIAYHRIFSNETGTIPAVGAEGDSYVGQRTTSPFDLLGTVDGVAVPWDTNDDPTGNNRTNYDPNGSGQNLKVETTWIDGQTTTNTFTFTTSNAPAGSTPVIAHGSSPHSGGTSSTSITVPSGVDRFVLVHAHYRNNTGTPMSGLTLGGVEMTNIPSATRASTVNTGSGVWTAYLTEDFLTTGAATLTPSYASTPPASSTIVYEYWTGTNVASPVFAGIYDFANVADSSTPTLTTTLTATPANSMLFTSCGRENIAAAASTVDVGTPYDEVSVSTSPTYETRAAYLADSGASADETVVWSSQSRSHSVLVSLDYATSSGGEEVTPITPGTPVLDTPTTPADNRARFTWPVATDAIFYEYRWGTSNPPASAVSSDNTSRDVTITGLAAGTTYYFQARSVSSTDTRSAWSTAVSVTATGQVTPPPTFSGKFLVATNAYDAAYSQGGGPMRYPDLWIPTTTVRKNPGTSESQLANMMVNANLDGAISNYINRSGGNNTPFITAMGPRLIWTARLGISIYNQSKGTPAQSAASILDMGKSGSTGTVNRDDTWIKVGNDLNRVYRGFNVWEMVFLSISHELNGPWSSGGYMGKNTALIGQPVLTGATNAQYGAAMGAALRKAGTTGECADVHRLACEHIIDLLWDINPNIIIGMTPADGETSTPEDLAPSNLSTSWVYDAFPDRPLDFICPTIHARGGGGVVYDGSGSIDDASNYTRPDGWMEHTQEFINGRYGCAGGLLESGATYSLPGLTPGSAASPNGQTDEEAVAFFEILNEQVLPNLYDAGIAFVNHWTVPNWAAAANPGTGTSFHLLEGRWGNFPDKQYPTSTAKPSWSTTTTPGYTKTLNWFQRKFGL